MKRLADVERIVRVMQGDDDACSCDQVDPYTMCRACRADYDWLRERQQAALRALRPVGDVPEEEVPW